MENLFNNFAFVLAIVLFVLAIIRLFGGWIFRTREIMNFQKAQLRQMQKQVEMQRRMIKILKEERQKSAEADS